MIYISIGIACNVKYQINKHRNKNETLFFDWLMASMKSVIDILGCKDIDTILNVENIIADPNDPVHNNNARLLIKSLDFCVSIHDVPAKFTYNHIVEFIDKYKRRYKRIIDYIKSTEKIYFLRYNKVSQEDINAFKNTILKINPKCNFALIVVDDSTHNNIIHKYDHCLIIEPSPFISNSPDPDWTTSNYNWKQIFSYIEELI